MRGQLGRSELSCHLVPISAAYDLVGRLRSMLAGFTGGDEAQREIDRRSSPSIERRGGQTDEARDRTGRRRRRADGGLRAVSVSRVGAEEPVPLDVRRARTAGRGPRPAAASRGGSRRRSSSPASAAADRGAAAVLPDRTPARRGSRTAPGSRDSTGDGTSSSRGTRASSAPSISTIATAHDASCVSSSTARVDRVASGRPRRRATRHPIEGRRDHAIARRSAVTGR